MSSGNDMQFGLAVESTYGTRVTPTRFFDTILSESITFEREFYVSQALGGARWKHRRVQTTRRGTGSWEMEVPVAGFGYILNLLHGNTVTPAQQASTAAYLQTHSLSTAPSKSATVQVGRPFVGSATVQPFDYLGAMLSGIEFNWDTPGILTCTPALVAQEEKTDQTLATVTLPTDSGLFSFKGGSITIGGSSVGNIIGSGSLAVAFGLRDDVHYLGSDGKIAQPTETERPAFTGQVTADFDSLTAYNRVVNGTLADVVVTFEGATIASTYKEMIRFTIPDAGFTGPPPNVDGPGPLTETISFEAASTVGTGGDIPKIEYQSIDTAI